jgi:hypothetical protein
MRICSTGVGSLLALLLLLPSTAGAAQKCFQDRNEVCLWYLEDRGYFEPPVAGPREATMKVMFPAVSDAVLFVQRPGRRMVWDISVGAEIPLLGYETSLSSTKDLTAGEWGVGLWLPIAFHMIEDFKDDSDPILDTDYRFGGALKFAFGLADLQWLEARLYIGHESTHIGDEFALAAQRADPTAFMRINVSHEDWDGSASYRAIWSELHHVRAIAGVVGLLDPDAGYYSHSTLETNGRAVTPSNNNFEPYLAFEWFHEEELLGTGWGPWLSLDLRYRSAYEYQRPSRDVDEARQLSFNVLLGIRQLERPYLGTGVPDLYLRYYRGVNPAGQFRSQRDYDLYGFGIHVPL